MKTLVIAAFLSLYLTGCETLSDSQTIPRNPPSLGQCQPLPEPPTAKADDLAVTLTVIAGLYAECSSRVLEWVKWAIPAPTK